MPFIDSQSYINIYYGGAGSGKSVFNAQKTVLDMMTGGRNYLVVREVYGTLEESFYNELIQAISQLGLNDFFKCKTSPLKITCYNGYQILFRGLDDIEKAMSIRPRQGVLTDILIEEATDISKKNFNKLTTRLRGKTEGKKKRFHLIFNPVIESHWIRKMFFDGTDEKFYQDKDLLILKTTHLDNSHLDPEDHKRYENYKQSDPYMYQVYTLGNWGVLKGLIFSQADWEIADLSEVQHHFPTNYHGQDFGWEDPKAYVRLAIDENTKTIYMLQEVGGSHITNMDFVPKIINIVGSDRLSCDSADANSIEEFKDLGIKNSRGVAKPKGSIVFGIQWLKNYHLIVDILCINTILELKGYSWLLDKAGESTGTPLDKNNHYIDAIRYALYNYMKSNGTIQGIQLPF